MVEEKKTGAERNKINKYHLRESVEKLMQEKDTSVRFRKSGKNCELTFLMRHCNNYIALSIRIGLMSQIKQKFNSTQRTDAY